mgnify:CR=1 FL=1
MTISIVVPVLNEAKILDDILSVYTRSRRAKWDAELIVSDGGSTDGTIEIAKAHADKVVRHIAPHKQTIAEGRNCGADVATGTVLVFINGDTVPADVDSFLAVISEYASKQGRYRRAAALACPVNVPPAERKRLDAAFALVYNGYVHMLNTLRIGAGRGECQIVRRDIFRRVGGYRGKLAAGEDFDLLARIGLRARVRFAPELVVFESPRRFRKFGYFRVLFLWTINALSVMVRGRSSSDEWEAVR